MSSVEPWKAAEMTSPTTAPDLAGLAPVNGLQLYYECYGSTPAGGTALILLHGGFGSTGMFGELPIRLAEGRQVIAVDLQGHGRTADVDRPLTWAALADDVAALVDHLGLGAVDLMGYSLGGGVALSATISHPEIVRRLVLVSTPFRQTGWYPEITAQMAYISRRGFEMMRHTPMFEAYAAVAPDPDGFPELMDKVGGLLGTEYDWTDQVSALRLPVLLIVGDADSIPVSHAAEFFELLGGSQRDGGWDSSGMSTARLAILPGTTHFTSFTSPLVAQFAGPFLQD